MQKIKSIIIHILKKLKLIIATIISVIIFIFKSESSKNFNEKKLSNIEIPQKIIRSKSKLTDNETFHDNSNLNFTPIKERPTLKDIILFILNIEEHKLTNAHHKLLDKLENTLPKDIFENEPFKTIDVIEDEIINFILENPKYKEIIHKKSSKTLIEKTEKITFTHKVNHEVKETPVAIPSNYIETLKEEQQISSNIKIEDIKNSSTPKENSVIHDVVNYSLIPPLISDNKSERKIKNNPQIQQTKDISQETTKENFSINYEKDNIKLYNSPSQIIKTEKIQLEKNKAGTFKEILPKNNDLNQHFTSCNTLITNIECMLNNEKQKEELEEKNYDVLEIEINNLLTKIDIIKTKNSNPKERLILSNLEIKAKNLEAKIYNQKTQDIIKEKNQLNESITYSDIIKLETEINKLHLEHNKILNENFLTKIEDIKLLDKNKAKNIEKKLLKAKLKKTANIPIILKLPFIKNKYFSYLSYNLFINNHFLHYNSILTNSKINYIPTNHEHIKKGYKALNLSIYLVKENLAYLKYLEKESIKKHPELLIDPEFLIYLTKTKNNLLKNQEKLLAKKELIKKYNLNSKYHVLKRTKNQH